MHVMELETDFCKGVPINFCHFMMAVEEEIPLDENNIEDKNDHDDCSNKNENGLPLKQWCDFPGCHAKFNRPWKLAAHRCIHTGERPYKCNSSGCNKSYTNSTHLRRHISISHSKKNPNEQQIAPKIYKCESPGCSSVFQNKYSVRKHFLKKHDASAPGTVKCPNCDLVFSKKHYNKFHSHMVTHGQDKPFKCGMCNHSFVTQQLVLTHMKKHKIYKCTHEDCPEGYDKNFNSRNELRSHLAKVHPTKFVCELCNKTFPLQCRLIDHLNSCGSDKMEKRIKCTMEDCTHMFKLQRNMLQHVRYRHTDPSFVCMFENCGKKFIWKASLNRHKKIHEQTNTIEEVISSKQVEKKPRKKRKDKPKLTAAELMSGVIVDPKTKMELLNRKEVCHYDNKSIDIIEVVYEGCLSSISDSSLNNLFQDDESMDSIDNESVTNQMKPVENTIIKENSNKDEINATNESDDGEVNLKELCSNDIDSIISTAE